MRIDRQHLKRAMSRIREILLRDWDPIGVASIPEAQDEYDSYVGQVYQLLVAGPSAETVANHLVRIETERMGLPAPALVARHSTAEKLLALRLSESPTAGPFPCPACGFLVFDEAPGSYAICPICNWEDDQVQLRHPALAGGANRVSLCAAQRRSVELYPPSIQLLKGFRRDPLWRPLSPEECALAMATLSAGGHLPTVTAEFNAELYYWLADSPSSAG